MYYALKKKKNKKLRTPIVNIETNKNLLSLTKDFNNKTI